MDDWHTGSPAKYNSVNEWEQRTRYRVRSCSNEQILPRESVERLRSIWRSTGHIITAGRVHQVDGPCDGHI